MSAGPAGPVWPGSQGLTVVVGCEMRDESWEMRSEMGQYRCGGGGDIVQLSLQHGVFRI